MGEPTVAELAAQLATLHGLYQQELIQIREQMAATQFLAPSDHPRSTLKAKPPAPFDGNTRQDPTEWCYAMDIYFNACGETSDSARVTFAHTCMAKDALTWLRAVNESAAFHISTWDEFKKELIHQFQRINPHTSARDTLATMRQRASESVRVYATAMRRVFIRLPTITEDEKIDRFIRGLRDQRIRQECCVRDMEHTFEAVAAFADRLEGSLFHARPKFNTNFDSHSNRHQAHDSQAMELGVVGYSARMTPSDRERLMAEGRCYYCKEKGHRALNCPKKKDSRQGNSRSRQ